MRLEVFFSSKLSSNAEIGLRPSMYRPIELIAGLLFSASATISSNLHRGVGDHASCTVFTHHDATWFPYLLYESPTKFFPKFLRHTRSSSLAQMTGLHVPQVSRNRSRDAANRVGNRWTPFEKSLCDFFSKDEVVGRPMPPDSPPAVLCEVTSLQ